MGGCYSSQLMANLTPVDCAVDVSKPFTHVPNGRFMETITPAQNIGSHEDNVFRSNFVVRVPIKIQLPENLQITLKGTIDSNGRRLVLGETDVRERERK